MTSWDFLVYFFRELIFFRIRSDTAVQAVSDSQCICLIAIHTLNRQTNKRKNQNMTISLWNVRFNFLIASPNSGLPRKDRKGKATVIFDMPLGDHILLHQTRMCVLDCTMQKLKDAAVICKACFLLGFVPPFRIIFVSFELWSSLGDSRGVCFYLYWWRWGWAKIQSCVSL